MEVTIIILVSTHSLTHSLTHLLTHSLTHSGALTNQQLERELDMESIASSETYKLEAFENELEFAAARKVTEKQINL